MIATEIGKLVSLYGPWGETKYPRGLCVAWHEPSHSILIFRKASRIALEDLRRDIGAAGKKWERFSGWSIDGAWTSGNVDKAGEKIARVTGIKYDSDKHSKKVNRYVHAFEGRAILWANKRKNPTLLQIRAKGLKLTARGIEG